MNGVEKNYDYTCDAAGRLETVTKNGSVVEEYAYDINGTRIFERNVLRGITGRGYAYSVEDHLLSAGDVTYQYDVDGFLTSKTKGVEVTTYTYSSRGELLSVSFPDGRIIEYIHDPLGRRIAKKVNGVTVEKYLWSGLTKLLAVYDGSDSLKMRFEYADPHMPVTVTMAGTMYYLAYDQVGSLRLVADGAGNVLKEVQYDSFGNLIFDSNPGFEIPFGFAGGLYDKDTGLVRFGYRDYDPDTGRWAAKDPILFVGGDTDLYGYVLNDPVDLVDPWGLDATVTLYPGASGFGHVGIGVNSTQTTAFYPVPGASTWDVLTGQPVPGVMLPDTRTPQQSITIPTTPAQDQAIQDFINIRTANPGVYDLNSRNCATTVRDALITDGTDTPETILPRTLMRNLQQQFGGQQ